MKKLIINEKNLPKIGKTSDSNIRIRINKIQNLHQSTPAQKSIPATIQEIDLCLQTLQKLMNGTTAIDQDLTTLIVQLLRQYKHVLNPNIELMTQSLKFSKLKFKTAIDAEEKENSPVLTKTQKNGKELPASDRISRLVDKSQNIVSNKSQKNRKFLSMHKKNSEILESITDESEKVELLMRRESSKEEDHTLAESRQSKLDHDKTGEQLTESYDESIIFQSVPATVEEPRIKYLEEQVEMLRISVKDKTQQIGELQERIEQLGANVQNLVRKNSQKSEEYNKLYEENFDLIEKLKKLSGNTQNNEQLEQLKKKCKGLEDEKESICKKKDELQRKLQVLEKEKEQRLDHELGRYETAQQFYQLTRRDLREQNENLMSLLEERQSQLANLYQVVGFNSNIAFISA